MKNLFLGEYSGYSKNEVIEDISSNYDVERQIVEQYEILIAILNNYGYEEDSYLLMLKDGVLYENFGSHCSCYGFEGQFEPEETLVEYLLSENYNHRDNSEIMDFLKSGILRNIYREKKLLRLLKQ